MNYLRIAGTYVRIIHSYKRGKTRLAYFPPLLWVEPTNGCNLRCVMCPNSLIAGKPVGFLEMDIFRKIVDEFSRYYPDDSGVIALFLGGESLLHKRIFEMIAYARGKRVNVNLATNGTLLSEEAVDALLRNPPTLLILSFDGYDKTSYEATRQGAQFEKTLSNISHLLAEKRRRGLSEPRTRLYSLVTKGASGEERAREREKFTRFFRSAFRDKGVDEFLVADAGSWTGLFPETGGVFTPKVKRGRRFHPCVRLWDSMSILQDGTVVPCCADFTGKLPLGNVRDRTLMEIWNGEAYRAIRDRMLRHDIGDVDLCSRGCEALYPAEAFWGIPEELLVHKRFYRIVKGRVLASRTAAE